MTLTEALAIADEDRQSSLSGQRSQAIILLAAEVRRLERQVEQASVESPRTFHLHLSVGWSYLVIAFLGHLCKFW